MFFRRWVGAMIFAAALAGVGHDVYTTTDMRADEQTQVVRFVRGTQLDDAARQQVRLAVEVLRTHPNFTADVFGHTAPIGDADANLDLSARRAEAVKAEIAAQGIDAARLYANGKGGEAPLPRENGESDTAWAARQARVDIVLKGPPRAFKLMP